MEAGKAARARKNAGKGCKKDAVTTPNEDYLVGQVANSLFQNKPTASGAGPLAQLFSIPVAETQPVYVPVPRESKKRKHQEEEIADVQRTSAKKEPLKKQKKAKKKGLSLGEESVTQRECALEQADEEEEEKEAQIKHKLKNKHSQLIAKRFSTLDEDAGIQKKRKQINPVQEVLKNKRTLFVGNLPVSCTTQFVATLCKSVSSSGLLSILCSGMKMLDHVSQTLVLGLQFPKALISQCTDRLLRIEVQEPKMLKTFFKEYGQIESIRFRSLIPAEDTLSKKMAAIKRKVHPNMKYVNAYVVFKEECAANNALKRNGTEFVSGFHIRVDLASKSTCHDNKRSVFVGNLPFDIDDDTVRNHFSDCGDVTGVRIVRDRNTGIGKGFGYVLFETTDAVHLALKLNNSELKGRKLRVQRCVEKPKTQQKTLDKKVKKPIGQKYTKASSLKNEKRSSGSSFTGEKAVPIKKSKKAKSKNSMRKKQAKSK